MIDIRAVIAKVREPFKPQDLVRANDAIVRVARLRGDFPWHTHDEDELFLCFEGSFAGTRSGRGAEHRRNK